MFKIIGQVVNTFTVEAGKDKDGNEYDETYKVQLMGKLHLENGDSRVDLVDLKVDDLDIWKPLKGKNISIDVGEFSPGKGRIIHFVRKGAIPNVIGA